MRQTDTSINGEFTQAVTPRTRLLNSIMSNFGLPTLDEEGYRIYKTDLSVEQVYITRADLCTKLPEVCARHGLTLPANWKSRIQAGINADIAREDGRLDYVSPKTATLVTIFATEQLINEAITARNAAMGSQAKPGPDLAA